MNINVDFIWQGEESIALINQKDTPSKTSVCTILVLDDDPSIQRLIQQTLSPQAEIIQELDCESDRIAKMQFDDVDAILLDYKLPRENGLDLLKQFREAYPELPILFMTGFGDLDIARKSIAAGANEYFPKPFDLADLKKVISNWVPAFDPNKTDKSASKSLDDNRSLATNIAEEENYLTATDPNGNPVQARVIRYNSRAIVVETTEDLNLPKGTPLTNTMVTLGHRSIEISGAEVKESTHLAERSWIEIGLPGVWQIEGFKEDVRSEEVAKIVQNRRQTFNEPIYKRFESGVIERTKIPDSLRSAILDFESILEEVHTDLMPFEKLMNEVGLDERASMEEEIVQYCETRFYPLLSEAMSKFEKAGAEAHRIGIKKEFSQLAQKRLFPMILCSPFISRVVAQPIGVPGDFGILGQLLGHPYQGHNLYSRLVNGWILTSSPSAAYRFRIDLLEKAINETQTDGDQPRKVLSMASGVAYEVQRFVTKENPRQPISFELVDFSNRTLLEAKQHFAQCRKEANPNGVEVTLRQGSVIDLAKNTKRQIKETDLDQYDLVYCAGLFDYLSDRMCSRVVSYLYKLVKPGGKLIVSNYTPENSLRYFMGMVMDWELVHRNTTEFDALMKTTLAKEKFDIVEDSTGTELYAIAEKL